jgi:hypothetical protein
MSMFYHDDWNDDMYPTAKHNITLTSVTARMILEALSFSHCESNNGFNYNGMVERSLLGEIRNAYPDVAKEFSLLYPEVDND